MNSSSPIRPSIPPVLRRQWAGFVVLCLSALGAGYLVLQLWWPFASIIPWLLVTTWVLSYQAVILWLGLRLNRYAGQPDLLPHLGMGTILILARGILLGLLAGFAVLECPPGCPLAGQSVYSAVKDWSPALLYTGAILIDLLESHLARRNPGQITLLREKLDGDLGALTLLTAGLVGVAYKQLPGLYLLVPMAYYLSIAGTWLRKRLGQPVHEQPLLLTRRLMVWIHKIWLCFALWPIFYRQDVGIVALLFMLSFVVSVVNDWLVTSGIVRLASPKYQQVIYVARQIADWFPICMRLILIVIMLNVLAGNVAWGITFAARPPGQGPAIGFVLLPLMLVEVLLMVMFGVGMAGRIAAAALLLLVLLGFVPGTVGLLTCTIAVLHLGTGRLSLWTEDRLLARCLAREPGEEWFDAKDTMSEREHLLRTLRSARSNLTEKWRVPMKMSLPVKILIGLGTAWVILSHGVVFTVWLTSFVSMWSRVAGSQEGFFPSHDVVFTLASWQIMTALVQFVLVTFYLIHVIKNTAASELVRVILGVGMFYLPFIAMPIYYYLYLWRDQPPMWALARSADQEMHSQDAPDSGSSDPE